MLAVSPLTSNNDGNIREGCTTMGANFSIAGDDFPDFSGANLLDSIDFDDLFMGMHEGDMLPDLEMDPELLAEFSISGGDESDVNNSVMSVENVSPYSNDDGNVAYVVDAHESTNVNDGASEMKKEHMDDNKKGNLMNEDVEIESKNKDLESESTTTVNSSFTENEKGKKHKSFSHAKSDGSNSNNQGKRKTKVDWTPELHRRFVQAVEQLGVDKAVPSRILELMGIDCLTRHNIASHLQKYRSHRKHLLAREAEAATWTQKRQMYGVAVGGGKGGVNISPWHPPTIGFPPMTPMHHPFRPLHVWGHPTIDPQARMPMWPKQLVPPLTAHPPAWTPPTPHPPPADPSFWHSSHQRRLPVPLVPGIPPNAMYRPDHSVSPRLTPQSGSHPSFELHPSKDSIDAAIGDILVKPWQPLPIGLKPPSTDSVLVELQRQGISKIPPTCS